MISCLVGINQLDSGEISIFGEPNGEKLHKPRLGYMPQESALTSGCTVREMIKFFGTIYGMTSEKFEERFQFLNELLELPGENSLIKNCSGGEQRRVSFALTLVHEPELLILDEPTVGVDPLLRNKIWEHLLELSQTKNVTVLLSTHYIQEAQQSNCLGIMRNGTQIAEDSPKNILRQCGTLDLEEAFLVLSQDQEYDNNEKNIEYDASASLSRSFKSSRNHQKSDSSVRQQTDWKIITAMLLKNLLQTLRDTE